MLNSCKRFYHGDLQPGEGYSARLAKNPRLFAAIHIHPIVAAYGFGGDVVNAIGWYGLLQAGVAVTLAMPLYLRRATATAITLLALLASQSALPLGEGLEWFIPFLFVKMLPGHAMGDEVIRAVANVLEGEVRRKIDLPARIGGEEFAVLLPEIHQDRAVAFAERIRKRVEASIVAHKDQKISVTVSIGVAQTFDGLDPDNPDELLVHAPAPDPAPRSGK